MPRIAADEYIGDKDHLFNNTSINFSTGQQIINFFQSLDPNIIIKTHIYGNILESGGGGLRFRTTSISNYIKFQTNIGYVLHLRFRAIDAHQQYRDIDLYATHDQPLNGQALSPNNILLKISVGQSGTNVYRGQGEDFLGNNWLEDNLSLTNSLDDTDYPLGTIQYHRPDHYGDRTEYQNGSQVAGYKQVPFYHIIKDGTARNIKGMMGHNNYSQANQHNDANYCFNNAITYKNQDQKTVKSTNLKAGGMMPQCYPIIVEDHLSPVETNGDDTTKQLIHHTIEYTSEKLTINKTKIYKLSPTDMVLIYIRPPGTGKGDNNIFSSTSYGLPQQIYTNETVHTTLKCSSIRIAKLSYGSININGDYSDPYIQNLFGSHLINDQYYRQIIKTIDPQTGKLRFMNGWQDYDTARTGSQSAPIGAAIGGKTNEEVSKLDIECIVSNLEVLQTTSINAQLDQGDPNHKEKSILQYNLLEPSTYKARATAGINNALVEGNYITYNVKLYSSLGILPKNIGRYDPIGPVNLDHRTNSRTTLQKYFVVDQAHQYTYKRVFPAPQGKQAGDSMIIDGTIQNLATYGGAIVIGRHNPHIAPHIKMLDHQYCEIDVTQNQLYAIEATVYTDSNKTTVFDHCILPSTDSDLTRWMDQKHYYMKLEYNTSTSKYNFKIYVGNNIIDPARYDIRLITNQFAILDGTEYYQLLINPNGKEGAIKIHFPRSDGPEDTCIINQSNYQQELTSEYGVFYTHMTNDYQLGTGHTKDNPTKYKNSQYTVELLYSK